MKKKLGNTFPKLVREIEMLPDLLAILTNRPAVDRKINHYKDSSVNFRVQRLSLNSSIEGPDRFMQVQETYSFHPATMSYHVVTLAW